MIEIRQTTEFADWLDRLKDINAIAHIQVRIRRLSLGNPGDVKPVGEGISELRIDYGPDTGSIIINAVRPRSTLVRWRQEYAERRYCKSQSTREGGLIMAVETKPWDPTEHLNNAEAIAAYVEAAFEDGDPALIAAVIGDVARARGMTQLAKEAGVSRETIYKAFSKGGNPTLETLTGVIRALGLKLTVRAA